MELDTCPIVRRLRPPRRRGFPADLSLGFYLQAPERMTYVWAGRPDRLGWQAYRFVAFDGRLITVDLPADARLFIWPAGHSPRAGGSVACRGSIWGRIPPRSLHGVGSRTLGRLHRLWKAFGQSAPPK